MMKVNYKQFKTVRISALLLATVGVVDVHICGRLPANVSCWPELRRLVSFAALISPTDPAIVIEIFKKLRVPKGLSTLMEFEAELQ